MILQEIGSLEGSLAVGDSSYFRSFYAQGNIQSDRHASSNTASVFALGFKPGLRALISIQSRPGAVVSSIQLQIFNSSSMVTGRTAGTFKGL